MKYSELKKFLPLIMIGSISALSVKTSFGASSDYSGIITAESSYIASCVASSGAITMGRSLLYKFQGTSHYKISPYFANFAATALLDDPTASNLEIVKNWMIWVFNHLNPDGSIYDYYVDKLVGGTDLPSTDAYAGENIPDFDSQDSYAATFMTLARRYVEVVPSDTSWLREYSKQMESMGNALYSVADDSGHYFGPDSGDGLTIAKIDYRVKYTMDNSEVNEGIRDMIWLEENISTNLNSSFYQNFLNKNNNGFANLWNDTTSSYYAYEGGPTANWNTFYADATCQLYPIWTGTIPATSARATELYDTFNAHYPNWQNGTYYDSYPWTIICYVASVMNDSSRVNSYLSFVQRLLNRGENPPNWYNMEAAFTLRAAKWMSTVTDVKHTGQLLPGSPALEQNYPNPFNPSTEITVRLNQNGMMSLKIYDDLGQLVKVVDQGFRRAGRYSYNVDMDNLASGVYFDTLKQGTDVVITQKMLLLR